MRKLGAKQKNIVWSWCAVNHDNKRVYLSTWIDKITDEGYILRHADHDLLVDPSHPAYKDQAEKFDLIRNEGYEAWGYFIEAEDTTVIPRKIKRTVSGFVIRFDMDFKESGEVIGKMKGREEV